MTKVRRLVIVFGDQLDPESSAFDGFQASCDRVWMAESADEAAHVWSSQPRIAVFFAAMRHFRDELEKRGIPILYRELALDSPSRPLEDLLEEDLIRLRPQSAVCVQPGEWRVREAIKKVSARTETPLDEREDRHFLSDERFFQSWAQGRKELRLEYFYRELRRRLGILMDESGRPVGGAWNFDADNRAGFGKSGPTTLPDPIPFSPDAVTRDVLALVSARFRDHPGSLSSFRWPVTRAEARAALQDFIETRLPDFGARQDAMWSDEPFLYHSLLSAALNLKLLNPREVVAAAERAYRDGRAPINAVEGFIRQILGWREYVRHVYWRRMPDYASSNALSAREPLPAFYWTGDTPLACLRQVIGQTLAHGYAHHIQRLMVAGLYAQLLGVAPRQIHEWFLAVYVDAVEWVEMPNVLGMSQYADGGFMSSKPYVATGKYIQRMSNYCASCPMDPSDAVGPRACPFTTLYWDFLSRHETPLRANMRMRLQVKNLDRLSAARRAAIQRRAQAIRNDPSCASLAPPRDEG